MKAIIIRPQPGYQEKALSSPADIVIGGGAAGSGKTWALLMEAIRHKDTPRFGARIFRSTTPQIRNQGGLWDESMAIYPIMGGKPIQSALKWEFPSGASIKFGHLENEKDIYDHQGAQYPFIGFDELTHFSKKQFFYLLTRNRSTCGVKPYVRCTCNPDPKSWVAEFISWWIDQETGYPIPERDGVLRYFVQDGNNIVWGNTKQEVIEQCPHIFDKKEFEYMDTDDLVKSVTFIRGSIYENKELLDVNPQYLGNLLSQEAEVKAQLLDGNWKISMDGLGLFNFDAIRNIFDNIVETTNKKYITCDVARFGSDLAVVAVWDTFKIIHLSILTKCSTSELVQEIERLRNVYFVSKLNTLVDQDGVGGGVVDEGKYKGFSGGLPALVDPSTGIKENYANLKTQCYYRTAERVNRGEVQIDLSNVYIDGNPTLSIKLGEKTSTVQELIKSDLLSIRRQNADMDGKKQINDKKSQKTMLGRSPDLGDTIMMREYFSLKMTENNAPLYYV